MIPSVEDLKDFLEKNQAANFSQIARKFRISVITVSELIKPLERDNVVLVERVGQHKFVKLLEKSE